MTRTWYMLHVTIGSSETIVRISTVEIQLFNFCKYNIMFLRKVQHYVIWRSISEVSVCNCCASKYLRPTTLILSVVKWRGKIINWTLLKQQFSTYSPIMSQIWMCIINSNAQLLDIANLKSPKLHEFAFFIDRSNYKNVMNLHFSST